jgi:amylosucrase
MGRCPSVSVGRTDDEVIVDPTHSTPATSATRDSSSGSPIARSELSDALRVAADHLRGLAEGDIELFTIRLARWWPELIAGWSAVYAGHPGAEVELERLVGVLADRYRSRNASLRTLDLERLVQPDWFQQPSMIGYVCYPARFGGTLRGVEAHLDYLDDLHVRYLHLMPLLRPRDGEADGGYAVADYRSIDPSLGTMDDLEHLCDQLRAHGMSLCIDLVLNHTASSHEWAVRARAGDADAAAMYLIYPDRTMPDRYEATLPETFPELAPGNFSQLADGRWVWTTFHEYQWDLDWSNPAVFVEMTDVLLELANRGVEVFRLDAVAFMWKRLGTDCQNQPEVHDLLHALRGSARIAAPAIIFKAEAIVGPDDLVAYLGLGRHHGRVADMAYHNSLMVQFWSAVATRDTRLMTNVLRDLPRKPSTTAWATYIRCHDDIGWAIMEADAERVGWDGPAHRQFLSSFYAGDFPGSFARGERFNHVPATGDSRISGTFASLAGLEAAVVAGDPVLLDHAIDRIRLGHALVMAWDGVPLIYMGDEIGLTNDRAYLGRPDLAADNRWLHRPQMDWTAAERRLVPDTVEARIFDDLRRLSVARGAAPQLHAATPLDIVDLDDPALFAFVRTHPQGTLLAVHNFADQPRTVDLARIPVVRPKDWTDLLDPGWAPTDGVVDLVAHGVRWIVAQDRAR